MNRVLVTGATGNVGQEVVKLLAASGAPVAAAVRNPAQVQDRIPAGVAPRLFDFTAPETFAAAFAGIQRLFLVRPPAISDVKRDLRPALAAARQAGVEQVTFLSLQGIERNRFAPHHAIEALIRELGFTYTFLRAGFFMQNLNVAHRAEIRDRGEICIPAGDGRTSFIDVRDIAAVAALALTEDGHAGKAYTLTGGAALTYGEVAAIMSEELGRSVRYTRPGLWQFIRSRRRQGEALGYILVVAGIYTTVRLGRASGITQDTARLLGRPPIPLRQYVKEYRVCWE